MTNFRQASLIEPEMDILPFGPAEEIFRHLAALPREEKPTLAVFHNGRVLVSASGPGHRAKIEEIGATIQSQHWGNKLHHVFTTHFSAEIWETTI